MGFFKRDKGAATVHARAALPPGAPTGPADNNANVRAVPPIPYGANGVAFKSRPAAQPPSSPNTGQPWDKRFIPPLALFNDAAQWITRKIFVQMLPTGQSPDSNPPIAAQYFTPPPVNALTGLQAGMLNLQLQQGNIVSQGARLTDQANNYPFGSQF